MSMTSENENRYKSAMFHPQMAIKQLGCTPGGDGSVKIFDKLETVYEEFLSFLDDHKIEIKEV